jgi:hypothetical protein
VWKKIEDAPREKCRQEIDVVQKDEEVVKFVMESCDGERDCKDCTACDVERWRGIFVCIINRGILRALSQ